MSGRCTRQTPAERRRPAVAKKDDRQCKSCGTRQEPPTSRLCPAAMSPIQDDNLNTQLDMTGNLLQSSPVLNTGADGIPPAPPFRTTQESLNMLINTCSDLVTNMSNLQRRMDDNDAKEADRLNHLCANLSNTAQGKVAN